MTTPRMARDLRDARRADVVRHAAEIVTAYRNGTSLNRICRDWEVDAHWMRAQLVTWGVRVRSRAEAHELLRAQRPV
ncbi:hypothetical protein [Streptomyces sp. RFCAC02]|uniref:hypothetical protein n=1 Tax=Streptomyces sp. RFCAC02 TaxID=2499143 RepID=UPI0010222CBF|nr:hypothetical protein [Streptomyces sp. RFCAC02]